ncbi:MAG: hypothetical protein WDW38_008872 [Sanguina aurantia]
MHHDEVHHEEMHHDEVHHQRRVDSVLRQLRPSSPSSPSRGSNNPPAPRPSNSGSPPPGGDDPPAPRPSNSGGPRPGAPRLSLPPSARSLLQPGSDEQTQAQPHVLPLQQQQQYWDLPPHAGPLLQQQQQSDLPPHAGLLLQQQQQQQLVSQRHHVGDSGGGGGGASSNQRSSSFLHTQLTTPGPASSSQTHQPTHPDIPVSRQAPPDLSKLSSQREVMSDLQQRYTGPQAGTGRRPAAGTRASTEAVGSIPEEPKADRFKVWYESLNISSSGSSNSSGSSSSSGCSLSTIASGSQAQASAGSGTGQQLRRQQLDQRVTIPSSPPPAEADLRSKILAHLRSSGSSDAVARPGRGSDASNATTLSDGSRSQRQRTVNVGQGLDSRRSNTASSTASSVSEVPGGSHTPPSPSPLTALLEKAPAVPDSPSSQVPAAGWQTQAVTFPPPLPARRSNPSTPVQAHVLPLRSMLAAAGSSADNGGPRGLDAAHFPGPVIADADVSVDGSSSSSHGPDPPGWVIAAADFSADADSSSRPGPDTASSVTAAAGASVGSSSRRGQAPAQDPQLELEQMLVAPALDPDPDPDLTPQILRRDGYAALTVRFSASSVVSADTTTTSELEAITSQLGIKAAVYLARMARRTVFEDGVSRTAMRKPAPQVPATGSHALARRRPSLAADQLGHDAQPHSPDDPRSRPASGPTPFPTTPPTLGRGDMRLGLPRLDHDHPPAAYSVVLPTCAEAVAGQQAARDRASHADDGGPPSAAAHGSLARQVSSVLSTSVLTRAGESYATGGGAGPYGSPPTRNSVTSITSPHVTPPRSEQGSFSAAATAAAAPAVMQGSRGPPSGEGNARRGVTSYAAAAAAASSSTTAVAAAAGVDPPGHHPRAQSHWQQPAATAAVASLSPSRDGPDSGGGIARCVARRRFPPEGEVHPSGHPRDQDPDPPASTLASSRPGRLRHSTRARTQIPHLRSPGSPTPMKPYTQHGRTSSAAHPSLPVRPLGSTLAAGYHPVQEAATQQAGAAKAPPPPMLQPRPLTSKRQSRSVGGEAGGDGSGTAGAVRRLGGTLAGYAQHDDPSRHDPPPARSGGGGEGVDPASKRRTTTPQEDYMGNLEALLQKLVQPGPSPRASSSRWGLPAAQQLAAAAGGGGGGGGGGGDVRAGGGDGGRRGESRSPRRRSSEDRLHHPQLSVQQARASGGGSGLESRPHQHSLIPLPEMVPEISAPSKSVNNSRAPSASHAPPRVKSQAAGAAGGGVQAEWVELLQAKLLSPDGVHQRHIAAGAAVAWETLGASAQGRHRRHSAPVAARAGQQTPGTTPDPSRGPSKPQLRLAPR